MEYLDNTGRQRLGDALREPIDDDAKLSIIASYFTVFAFGELKEELSKVDELRFIFSEPTFAKQMEHDKSPREFVLSKRSRERGIGGTGLELTLRNNLNQRALARECADWVRSRATFKTARQSGMIATTGTYHVQNAESESQAFMGSASNGFTLEGLGYERKPGVITGVSHFQTTSEAMGLKAMFDGIWHNPGMVEEVTDEVIAQAETLYRENSPEFVYFLTLYHLFRDFTQVAAKTEAAKNDVMAKGIKYTKLPESDWYTMDILAVEDLTAYLGQNAWEPLHGKSAYNYVVYDSSTIEQPYAVALDQAEMVKVFAKLPSKFKIDTPLGSYNPDWAYVEEADGKECVYFVIETKGKARGENRPSEEAKIECAEKHFEALGFSDDFRYDVETKYHYATI